MNEGWKCPRCGRIWSPNRASCDCKERENDKVDVSASFDKLTRKGDDIRKV